MRALRVGVGKALRETGQAIDRVGSRLVSLSLSLCSFFLPALSPLSLMGSYAFKEQLSRHRRVSPLGELRPSLHDAAFVAPNATVLGDVTLDRCVVW